MTSWNGSILTDPAAGRWVDRLTIRCGRCGQPLGHRNTADRPDPDPGQDRLLCRHCWSVLVLRPETRKTTA